MGVFKVCKKCGAGKSFSDFHVLTKSKDGRQPVCKACAIAYVIDWQKKNPDKLIAKAKKWHDKNKSEIKKVKKIWKAANKERIAIKNSEWKKKNADKVRESTMQRIAMKLRATPLWANRESILEIYKVAVDRTIQSGEAWHVDHIVPLRGRFVCGLHVENNLQVIPALENLRKGNKMEIL